MRKLALATVLFALAPTCEEAPDAAPENLSDCTSADGDPYDYATLSTTTGVRAEGARIDGDTLYVPVSFGGGCEDHTLVVCWPAQGFSKSLPPEADLEVWHDSGGDSCEAYLTEEAVADLKPLAEAHAEQFGTADPRMVLNIGEDSLEYVYTEATRP